MNRLNWEALDEESEELNIYVFKGTTKILVNVNYILKWDLSNFSSRERFN